VIRLHVMEPRIGKVVVEGNRNFDAASIRASLPALQPGATPNSQQVARNLQLLSGHPAKQTTVLFKSGATADELDAMVKVSDERPLKFSATLDNTGTDDSSRLRAGIGIQHSNLFNRDHVLNVQYATAPDNPHKAGIYGAGYRLPFYAYSSMLDLVAGYSDANTGVLPGLFTVTGSGTILGARYNLHLSALGEYGHKLSFGLNYRAYQSQIPPPGAAGIPGVTVHPASIGYSGLWRMTNAEFGFHMDYLQNVFSGGRHGADSDFKAARPGASADYRVWHAGMNYSHTLPREWQFRAIVAGQYTNDALIPGEQFGFGGPDSVRGFNLREVTDDRGYAGSLEIYTPELGPKFNGENMHARLLAFYDVGNTGRNNVLPGELSGQSGGSLGFGLRLTQGKHFNLRLDAAQVVNSAGRQARGDHNMHASAAIQF
jgi:hemolysin activation/secretion protein